MVPANSYQNVLKYLDEGHRPGVWMCGLLFAPPKTAIGKAIMERLDDWHYRSGNNIDFFCVGYVDWDEFEDDEPVGQLRDRYDSAKRQFYYSASGFHDVRDNVEQLSGWKYSGEADLILVNAVQDEPAASAPDEPRSRLMLEEIIALDIDKIVSEGVFTTPARLMERICQAADDAAVSGEAINVTDFSDREFSRTLLRRSLGAVIKKLSLDAPLGARHFLVGGQLLERV